MLQKFGHVRYNFFSELLICLGLQYVFKSLTGAKATGDFKCHLYCVGLYQVLV